MTVWINGRYRKDGNGAIALADRGFLLGDGLFETVLVKGGEPVFLTEHMERLAGSAAVIGMPLVHDEAAILKVIRTLVEKAESDTELFAARITVSRGIGPRGVAPPAPEAAAPVSIVTLAPVTARKKRSLSCMISSVRRNEGSLASSMKTLSYMDSILAKREAAEMGADEAVMLNNQAQVTCATAANIFLIADGERLLTPTTDSGVLPGIVRSKIIKLAREAGIPVETDFLFEEDLMAHRVFLTNSLMGLVQAHALGSRPRPVPPMLTQLKKAYVRSVEADIKARKAM